MTYQDEGAVGCLGNMGAIGAGVPTASRQVGLGRNVGGDTVQMSRVRTVVVDIHQARNFE